MKKRKFLTILSIALMSMMFVCASVIIATQAWFYLAATHAPTWKSSSQGAYFAYGNGKASPKYDDQGQLISGDKDDSPYGITRPIHLYNLAWLQYLGYFETDEVNDSYNLDNIYFELAADIDMTGWTLPPIGTKDHPFIGNFNGNGYKITGLTVSNDIDDYNRIPFGINRSDFPSKINIVGLFGVVGKYESNTIATYNSQANEIENVGINGLTIVSKSTDTLAGLAAGYVNGTISGVAVNNSYIDLTESGGQAISGFTNISDYSLIGHAADAKYLAQLQSSRTTHYTPTVSNPFYSQGGNDWGASIEIKKMYNTLHAKNQAGDYFSYTYDTFNERTRTDNGDGTYSEYTIIPASTQSTTETIQSANGEYFIKYNDIGEKDDGTQIQTGSYTFASDNAKNNLSSYQYVGLSGEKSLKDYTYTLQSDTVSNKSGYKYYDISTNNYLTSSNGTSISATNATNASLWFFDESNHLYVNINKKNYYLNNSGTTLSMSETPSSIWTWDATAECLKTGTYYLVYNNGWSLNTSYTYTVNLDTFTVSSGTNYLGVNARNTAPISTTAANAAKWKLTSGTNKYIYTTIGTTNYYINGTRSGNTYTYTLVTQTANNSLINNTGTALRFSRGNNNYSYLTFNGSSLYGSTTQTNLTFTYDTETKAWKSGRTAGTDNVTTYTQNTETRHLNTQATYYPLTWDSDNVNPSDKNTGYVVGGHNYENTSNYSIGDVRLAGGQYKTGQLTQSLTTGTTYSNANLFAYTFNKSNELVKIGDEINGKKNTSGYVSYETLGFEKYYYNMLGRASGSRVSMGTELGTSGNNQIAYGLHFMNADISKDRLLNVPYVKINGEEKLNYDLPQDSIDFNLKDAGFINFFAATFFINPSTQFNATNPDKSRVTWDNSNNSFFSLHWIDRNADGNDCTIDSIKQIAKIYKNTQYDTDDSQPKYVYTYRNASDNENANDYDTGVRNSNGIIKGTKGEMLFDTFWLTDPEYSKFTLKALYYFEIPVNKGEFALGSTSGKTKSSRGWSSYNKNGAYLLYLDIGASAKNVDGITIEDSSTTITKKYNYPIGVDFKSMDLATSDAADYTNILGGESAAVIIPSGNKQNINYSYTPRGEDKALLSVGPDAGGGTYTATYKTVGTEVKNKSGTSLGIVDASSSTDVMEREILYDLREMTGDAAISITPSISTVHTIDGVRGQSVSTTGTAVTLSKAIVETIATFETEEPVMLYVVDYTNTIANDDSNKVSIDSSYSFLDKTYTISFISSETGKTTDMMFVNLNISQTYTENNTSVTYTYTLIVQNVIDGTTSTQVGTITSSNLNEDAIIICVVPATS